MIQKKNLRAPFLYAAFSLFVLVFGMVYTHFGHGVKSDDMTFAFLPLQLTAFVYLGFAVSDKIPRPDLFSSLFLAFSVTAFTLYRLIKGILQIAGAYSLYDVWMWRTAIVCLVLAIVLYPTEIILKKKTNLYSNQEQ